METVAIPEDLLSTARWPGCSRLSFGRYAQFVVIGVATNYYLRPRQPAFFTDGGSFGAYSRNLSPKGSTL